MRIGIVAGPHFPVPPTKYGGTEQVISYLIKGLKEAGHEPILFGSGDSSVDCEIVPIVKKAIYFPKHDTNRASHERQLRRIQAVATKKIRQYLSKIDIIHSHGFDLIDFQDFPNLTTLHLMVNFDSLDYYLKRQSLSYVSISKNQQGSCPELSYVGVIYNGEDPKEFPIVKKPDDYLCFLGRFDYEKNPHIAIQLAITLGMPIKIAGKKDFHDEDYFDNKIKPYLDHPLVEYLGELGLKEKIKLLSKAKCNLHPVGCRESFGLTVLEAAYCGTPTLAIARGSMSELIEEGRTGLLVEDFVEGHNLIQQCFEMDREYIAKRARLLFNYRTMAQQYINAYEKVIGLTTAGILA
jgi:glycosyltransferase involved in cell wall biosynthesis